MFVRLTVRVVDWMETSVEVVEWTETTVEVTVRWLLLPARYPAPRLATTKNARITARISFLKPMR